MNITETTFNMLWNTMHKSEQDLLDQLQVLEAQSNEAQVIQATLDGLRLKKQKLEAVAKDNHFSESAFHREDGNLSDSGLSE